VEWVQGDGTARYITKYITKGCDLALVQVNRIKDAVSNIVNYDEFEEMRCGVYRTSSEAALAIFGHKIFSKAHLVETLYIHEPGNVRSIHSILPFKFLLRSKLSMWMVKKRKRPKGSRSELIETRKRRRSLLSILRSMKL
jgi:hypothetical protein